ncbi:methyl-accepting chemotaxis protein [Pandoraea anhela]|uniref:Chemotaxis protein n=1 Tax=Pandoraea anhela TaxID=2508295 RepID=A0A5E4WC10_9BURK|nr:methyl-accepting chemotaxis protein [Pandoraea anhela]VVE20645.1 chemotaxis protein [Pandoraea anhela]
MISSIRTLISAVCVAIVVLALVIAGAANYWVTRSYNDEQIRQTAQAVLRGHRIAIDEWVASKGRLIESMRDVAMTDDPAPAFAKMAQAGGFTKVYAGYPDKRFVTSDRAGVKADYDPTQRPWYLQVVKLGKPLLTAPYVSSSTGKLIVTFAAPFFRGNELAGVVAGDMSMDSVAANVDVIHPTTESVGFLVDAAGSVIVHPDRNLTLAPISKLSPGLSAASLAQLTATPDTPLPATIDGRRKLLFRQSVAGTDWALILALDAADANAGLRSLVSTSLIVLVLTAGMAALMLTVLVTKIFRRLSVVRNAMDAIGSGEGDLTQRLPADGRDEVAQIARSFNAFADKLTAVLVRVKGGSDEVSVAATEIAAGNDDLSKRTEAQAASLEETASSMEQLTNMVRQTSDNAQEAKGLAAKASSVAGHGGEVMGQVVETMGAIHDSARRIAEITAVIEGIAFQTNILALNAAVEAARAGSDGRGFAVVAGEVRSLAQRSASAATQIKSLIDDSVTRVGAGTELVERAGKTMSDIIAAVANLTSIMGEISQASEQQRAGIEQVNAAIGQMDHVTQQNAALVEQASAAATSLREQTQNLNEAVSTFRLQEALVA